MYTILATYNGHFRISRVCRSITKLDFRRELLNDKKKTRKTREFDILSEAENASVFGRSFCVCVDDFQHLVGTL